MSGKVKLEAWVAKTNLQEESSRWKEHREPGGHRRGPISHAP